MAIRTTLVTGATLLLVGGAILLWSTSESGSTHRPEAESREPIEPGVGIPEFAFRDLEGNEGTLSSLMEGRIALAIVMRTSECPVSRKYGHRLARMEKRFDSLNVGVAHLNVSPQDTPAKMGFDVETFSFEAPYLVDREGEIGGVLDARLSTEVYLIDATRTLRYRGAIDDQYGIDFTKPQPRETYLSDAVAALVKGEEIEISRTQASGCYLTVEHQHADTHSAGG